MGHRGATPRCAPRLIPARYRDAKVYAAVREDAPDFARFPGFAEATRTDLTVGPGECFFIPQLWWHNIRSPPGELSFSVNFWFGMPSGPRGSFDFHKEAAKQTKVLKQSMESLKEIAKQNQFLTRHGVAKAEL